MTASIKPNEIARAMCRTAKYRALVPRWYATTDKEFCTELESIVRADRMAMPDKEFRAKYADFIKGRN